MIQIGLWPNDREHRLMFAVWLAASHRDVLRLEWAGQAQGTFAEELQHLGFACRYAGRPTWRNVLLSTAPDLPAITRVQFDT